jgi:UDP-glucose 6-dehydrogenase
MKVNICTLFENQLKDFLNDKDNKQKDTIDFTANVNYKVEKEEVFFIKRV